MFEKELNHKEFVAPFIIKSDSEYYNDLRDRYKYLKQVIRESTSDSLINTVEKNADKVCDAIRDYFKGYVYTFHQQIENIIKNILVLDTDENTLNYSPAFPGNKGDEVQLFRARISQDYSDFSLTDMLHVPFSQRGKAGSYRFSILGLPSLYLSNSTYGCWIETGRPSDHAFNVSPFILDGEQKIFNIAVRITDVPKKKRLLWLLQIILMIATSYIVIESGRSFKSEYIVSQSIMLACQKYGYDGVAYYSKRVDNDSVALASVNLALYANFKFNCKIEYGDICKHIKVGEPMNYHLFKQLNHPSTYRKYNLRLKNLETPLFVGTKNRSFEYKHTDFFRFDEFLFSDWEKISETDWGNAIENKAKLTIGN